MKTIFFVRHGESQANVDGLIAGGELESPLTNNGRKQAKQAGQTLKDKDIDLIVSSPMERTRDTCEIIANQIGYDTKNILIDDAFIEVLNGFYSGKPYSLRNLHVKEGNLVADIESPDHVHARLKEAFARLKKRPENRIVVVSHGATGRMTRAIAEDIPYEDFMSHKPFGNTAIYEFTLK